MIPVAAVEAALESVFSTSELSRHVWESTVRALLEAAAPHMLAEAELMRWKLDALKEWADAMINESNSPQYGRDVRTLLNVASLGEAREINYL